MNQQGVRSIILIALGLVWGGLIATWAEQPKSGGTLPVAFEADVMGLDPAIPGLQNYYVNQNLFNTLVTLNENLEFIPDMAESWEIQAQGKFYLFHLHRGVKFHDGTDLDAAAVKWNLDRIIADEKAPAHRFFANVESSEVLDAHTLKITMRYPTTTLLSAFATNGTGLHIISPTSEKTWGKDVLRHPSGTRPFRFVTWEPNARIVLERYPYDPERARASLKEAGFDEKNPLRYTIMTHGAEPSLPTIATIIKTQVAARPGCLRAGQNCCGNPAIRR